MKKNGLRPAAGAREYKQQIAAYLSWVEMLPKLVFSLVPMPFTAAMMATDKRFIAVDTIHSVTYALQPWGGSRVMAGIRAAR